MKNIGFNLCITRSVKHVLTLLTQILVNTEFPSTMFSIFF